MEYQFAAYAKDLEEGRGVLVTIDGVDVGLFRVDGDVVAYRNDCPHQGGPVCEGLVVGRVMGSFDEASRAVLPERLSTDEIHLVCPWHSYEYDLRTGANAVDPTLRLRSCPVKTEDDAVFVAL